MATWNSDIYNQKQPPETGVGFARMAQHLHATAALQTTAALNDTINFGYLPINAVVTGVVLKAQSQLDSSGSPALTLDLGVTGTTQLWKAAITTVGRSAGVSGDSTIATAGYLYKNTSGAKLLVIGTIHAAAATAVAGNLEVSVSFFVEQTAGSNP